MKGNHTTERATMWAEHIVVDNIDRRCYKVLKAVMSVADRLCYSTPVESNRDPVRYKAIARLG